MPELGSVEGRKGYIDSWAVGQMLELRNQSVSQIIEDRDSWPLKKRVLGPGLQRLRKVGTEGSNLPLEQGESGYLASWVPRKEGTGALDSILRSEGGAVV